MKSALRIYLSSSYGQITILLNYLPSADTPPIRAAPDCPRKRGQNKTPRNTLFINGSTVSTGYSATVEVLHRTSKWGEVRLRRTMVSFIGMFTLVHPFATTWHFPSRGNEKFRGAFLLPPHRTAGGKVVRSTKGGRELWWRLTPRVV